MASALKPTRCANYWVRIVRFKEHPVLVTICVYTDGLIQITDRFRSYRCAYAEADCTRAQQVISLIVFNFVDIFTHHPCIDMWYQNSQQLKTT